MNSDISKLFVLTLLISAAFSGKLSNLKKSSMTQEWRKTDASDYGGGSVYFLDRQSLWCGSDEIMQGFRMIRPTAETVAYDFKCKKVPVGVATEHTTEWAEAEGVNFLDRQNVACPHGTALQGFGLRREANMGSKVRYSFKCVETLFDTSDCGHKDTPESWAKTDNGGVFTNIYLDRQSIDAGDAYAMSQFHLNTRYAPERPYYHYDYSFCKLAAPVTVRGLIKNGLNNQPFADDVLTSKNVEVSLVAENGIVVPAKVLPGSIWEATAYTAQQYKVNSSGQDFVNGHKDLTVNGPSDETNQENTIIIVPSVHGYRFIFTWNDKPKDLDIYAFLPSGEQVYWRNKVSKDGNVSLDYDYREGFGPETLTIKDPQLGVYKIVVVNFLEDAPLKHSGAKVTVYKDSEQVKVVEAPAEGEGKKWEVLSVDTATNTITEINKLSSIVSA